MKQQMPRIICADGFSVSVQASKFHYCTPHNDTGPYVAVELRFPSVKPPEEIMQYAEEKDNPCSTVYGWVPVELVNKLISSHGGIDVGKTLAYI